MELTLFILEIIGTVAFAVSGLIAGVNRNMDILGITIMAVVTATGVEPYGISPWESRPLPCS